MLLFFVCFVLHITVSIDEMWISLKFINECLIYYWYLLQFSSSSPPLHSISPLHCSLFGIHFPSKHWNSSSLQSEIEMETKIRKWFHWLHQYFSRTIDIQSTEQIDPVYERWSILLFENIFYVLYCTDVCVWPAHSSFHATETFWSVFYWIT